MKIVLTFIDKLTQQPVQNAIIEIPESGAKALTDINGRAMVNVPVGTFTAIVKYGDRYHTVAMKTRSIIPIMV